MANITIDGKDYDTDTFSDQAKATVASLKFVETKLQQMRNELAVADTARLAYGRAFKRELEKTQSATETVTGSGI